jgi:putative PIN family toxin of toxin-antitoxin system
MKIILDTNVFVLGIFFTGPPYRILEAWRDGALQLVLSQEILDEYRRVGFELAARYPSIDLNPMLEFVARHADMVPADPLPEQVCEDADDDKFIACALAAGCGVIVSGDKHLLKVSGIYGVKVMKPREFVETFFLTSVS